MIIDKYFIISYFLKLATPPYPRNKALSACGDGRLF
jgi:hypothetical protein